MPRMYMMKKCFFSQKDENEILVAPNRPSRAVDMIFLNIYEWPGKTIVNAMTNVYQSIQARHILFSVSLLHKINFMTHR